MEGLDFRGTRVNAKWFDWTRHFLGHHSLLPACVPVCLSTQVLGRSSMRVCGSHCSIRVASSPRVHSDVSQHRSIRSEITWRSNNLFSIKCVMPGLMRSLFQVSPLLTSFPLYKHPT
jgi:hypothetical protein